MYFKVDSDTIIRGHHVYKSVWMPVADEILECEQDTHTEAKEYDENAIDVYKPPGVYSRAAFIQGRRLMIFLHVPVAFTRGRH